MWEYKHTDEMYTGRFDRSEKLFHSDVYLGQEYSDGLYHWKYIKRERKNGKWVYYYKDDKLAEAKKKYDTDKAALEYENKKRGYEANSITYMHKGKEVKDPAYRKLGRDTFSSSVNYKFAKEKSDKRKKKYEAPIRVLNKASDINYNIKKKIKKGKKAIARFFKGKKGKLTVTSSSSLTRIE